MDSFQGTQSSAPGSPPFGAFGGLVVDAVHFWEPRRLLYNLVLIAVVLNWLLSFWFHFRPAITFFSLFQLSVLALLANVCYSAAYVVDIPMQCAARGALWKRLRWALWLMGTFLAVMFANYWIADEIYPYVHP